MATGRLTLVRAVATQSSIGRITRVRSSASSLAAGRITKVRSVAAGTTPYAATVEPFGSVTLPAGTWTQTGGPTVTVPTFDAPALPRGSVLTFDNGGSVATITVLPHTYFELGTAGALQPLHRT